MAETVRTEKRRKQRVPATVQMIVGEDDDLIEWVLGLADGKRNQTLKSALRYALGLPEPAPQASEFDAIRAELLDTLRQEVARVPAPADRQQLAEVDVMVRRLAAEVESLKAAYNGAAPAPSTIEEAPRISAEEIAERKNKMKKANW